MNWETWSVSYLEPWLSTQKHLGAGHWVGLLLRECTHSPVSTKTDRLLQNAMHWVNGIVKVELHLHTPSVMPVHLTPAQGSKNDALTMPLPLLSPHYPMGFTHLCFLALGFLHPCAHWGLSTCWNAQPILILVPWLSSWILLHFKTPIEIVAENTYFDIVSKMALHVYLVSRRARTAFYIAFGGMSSAQHAPYCVEFGVIKGVCYPISAWGMSSPLLFALWIPCARSSCH